MTSSQLNVAETPPMSQEDLETLAKNETDENGLILGKFKSVEDLAASYKELEGKLGSFEKSEETEEQVTEEQVTEEEPTTYNEIYGDGLADVLQEVGIDPEDITNRFLETGNINENDYKLLGEAGFSRQIIDTYLDGVRSQGDVEEIAKSEQASIKQIAGGEQGYEQLKSWATENLSDVELDAFDNLVQTAPPAAIKLAVQGLYSQYTNAMGIEPDLVSGRQSNSGLSPFRSAAEVTNAMNDPRYGKDMTYTGTVQERLRESDVFKSSR
tara:strand:- start:416 stop:1222 length:807 start_codon:yes stop_codon:yes gene_type:complete